MPTERHKLPHLHTAAVGVAEHTPDEGRAVPTPSIPDNKANLVTVLGFGKDDVLFRSKDVRTVQWRDPQGEIVAMLVSLKPGIWGITKRGDPDWAENVEIYGDEAG